MAPGEREREAKNWRMRRQRKYREKWRLARHFKTWEPRTHAEALSQTVLDDEPAERSVPGRELIVQRFIRATGPEIDIHFKPWIVDAVVISPAPTVVVVPVVYLRNIEFAAGGKARGEI